MFYWPSVNYLELILQATRKNKNIILNTYVHSITNK